MPNKALHLTFDPQPIFASEKRPSPQTQLSLGVMASEVPMNNSLHKELKERLILEGYAEIAEALDCKQTNRLSPEQKDILIKFSNLVKNGESEVKVNFGIAGPSPSSGESGFLSGIRGGFEEP